MNDNISTKKFLNLAQMVDFIGQSYRNSNALNFIYNGKWVNISTAEFVRDIRHLSLGLQKIGIRPGDNVGVMCASSPIWLIIDLAIIAARAVSVPVFPNISATNLCYEMKDAAVDYVFCDSAENLSALKNCQKNNARDFTKIIVWNVKEPGQNIIDFDELLKIGAEIAAKNPQLYAENVAEIREDDLATIVYTSGSTGTPKGVEITHRNLVSQIEDTAIAFPLSYESDKVLSCLPLAHIFERMVMKYYLSVGVAVYFVDDVKNVGAIINEVRPTLMTVVPRLLEKVFAKMKARLDEGSWLKKQIGNLAFNYALNHQPAVGKDRGLTWRGKIYDALVYKKLRAALGGKFRMMICGGAALSATLERFFNNIGIPLFVGYGTTESSPVIGANNPAAHKIGTIGKPFQQVLVMVAEDRELLARGPNIMRGYHNDPEKTAATIINGWLYTGDLAEIDQDGFIKIIGRKKELFKTANGKYVNPVVIEQKLMAGCHYLSGALIIAEGRRFVSCLLFADFDVLLAQKKKYALEKMSDEEFLGSNTILSEMERLVARVNSGLDRWEQIKKYRLIKDQISIAGGELTPSMKLRRQFIEEKYKNIIEEFYQE